jgi:tRNA(fMet)-specific endonuclease VapC
LGILIDTSVLVADERGRLDLRAWLAARETESFGISAVTLSELWVGVLRSTRGPRRAAREAYVRGVVDAYPVLPFDALVAESHARLWADLASRGRLIGAHDLLIAATAVASDHAVATLNVAEFGRIRGLEVLSI